MTDHSRPLRQPARTLLGHLIRERRMTNEEFVAYVERFAREHGETGTLTLRHLYRLLSGRRGDGRPLGHVQPATARLLERIFERTIDDLVAPLARPGHWIANGDAKSSPLNGRVDRSIVANLYVQLDAIRQVDRQLGALFTHDEVVIKVDQVTRLQSASLLPGVRAGLTRLLCELCTLAGWQALDLGDTAQAWHLYERGRSAGQEAGDAAFTAHTAAEQAFVMIDMGNAVDAARLLESVRAESRGKVPELLSAWLAAAHGEALAASGRYTASMQAFDFAEQGSAAAGDPDGPYVVLDATHAARWRGHALARLGDPGAVPVLTGALDRLNPSFTRAETGLRVDLACALVAAGELDEARRQAVTAARLADTIGSTRQHRRIRQLSSVIT